ncbi:MAG: AIR synthase family protein [Candidatus Thorarchaeota archaeon]|nr:AIR synthase family protein [Candidatus Thorarchaeota archaeon]
MGFNEFAFHALDTSHAHLPFIGAHLMFPGKVPPEILNKLVFSHLGVLDPNVLLGPRLGEDASLIQIGDLVVVASTDPITGSVEDIGWLVVHVNANDVATFGIAPRWFLVSIMLPSGSRPEELGRIMEQIDKAAKTLNIAVVGGHSEITERIEQPIVVGFMMGMTEKDQYVTTKGAQPGDMLLMTKSAAIEGTAILATEGYDTLSKILGADIIIEARKLREQISVVKDGIHAFRTGHVHAMHDPTEGGLAGGIHELCDASIVGFEIDYNAIPLSKPTRLICQALDINPLELISSGTMLITCLPKHADSIVNALRQVGIEAKAIGTIASDPAHRKIRFDGKILDLERPTTDALWSGLKKFSLP